MMSYLQLESGEMFEGLSLFDLEFCSSEVVFHEVVFQTGMVGYPEALTDPSYKNQILVITYPIIGNYGVPDNNLDEYNLSINFESNSIHVAGLVIGEYVKDYSHWNAIKSLGDWLISYNIPLIYNIDTRQLTKIIREHGVIRGGITNNKNIISDFKFDNYNLALKVTTQDIKYFGNPDSEIRILAIDCGIKNSQIRCLVERDAFVKLVPIDYNFLEDNDFNRIFISNGPGDPTDYMFLVNRLKTFIKINHDMPILGICLGHQILGIVAGFSTFKMKYGNRGHNIPCYLVNTNRCVITSQNHGYAVNAVNAVNAVKYKDNDNDNNWRELFVNANDGSNEGLYHKTRPYLSVQFHPEARAGPNDTEFIFDLFVKNKFNKIFKILKDSKQHVLKPKKVLILGSGGLCIGQSGEFDYSGSQAIKAYKEEGITTILINPNIATIQTSPGFADKVYFLPITPEYVIQVIKYEIPDCIAISFGGQTAINCSIELYKRNIFTKYDIQVLGTNIESIICTEDRQLFKDKLNSIGEQTIQSITSDNYEDAFTLTKEIGYPVLVRAAFALGGLGSGFANNNEELDILLNKALSNSSQVIVDKSLKGWKEVEYEVVRDIHDNCICVCNMENFDPLGIHTGESIVVAPSQTLDDYEYNMLRRVSIKVIRSLNIIGECNIQYALNPNSREYYIIEVNARLSRSSALASKATGYPLAYVAAKLSLNQSLLKIRNSITENTTACFEPSLDYCVIKIPRWDLDKFPLVDKKLDSSMKSVGEAMAISRCFEEALQKALRMSNESVFGLDNLESDLENPTPKRIFSVANALYHNKLTIDQIYNITKIDKWFLYKINNIIIKRKELETLKSLSYDQLLRAKQLGFSDKQISLYCKSTEIAIRNKRKSENINPIVKQIDTVAGEFPCSTNYLYTTYNGKYHDVGFNNNSTIVLGSGVYKIGSSVEFDWCCVSCIQELRELGKHTTVINCNPETVSTDYDEADRLYFDELTFETVMDIYELENPFGIILSMGGQIPNNIAMSIYRQNVNVIGTSPEMIDNAENRYKFSRLCDSLGVDQPKWKELTSIEEAKEFCNKVSYPCLIRPSYVLSGAAMNVAYSDKDLVEYLNNAISVSKDYPVVISKFINDAKEIEVDAVSSIGGNIKIMAISEHVENAGVHSGDATLILPPQDLTEETTDKIIESVNKIAKSLKINGPFNIQFIAKDDAVMVIECNLRVSRSFPFVSKTLNTNLIKLATKSMLGLEINTQKSLVPKAIGVKVPQFSFSRLKSADVVLNVDMVSTGEVACFGKTHYEAYIKALQASNITLPKLNSNILLSIGSYRFKKEFEESAKLLIKLGYKLYGTSGTADYYHDLDIPIMELPFCNEDNNTNRDTILNYIRNKQFSFVINISKKNKIRSNNSNLTQGYLIRRNSVDNSIPILTDIKCAKLLVRSLYETNNQLKIDTSIDCITSYKTVRLPGLIDVHVHVREPGNSYKEDWSSLTKAALAGGITSVCVMPNTDPPVIDQDSLDNIKSIASNKAHCDYAIFMGANTDNYDSVNTLSHQVVGLKMYLDNTYGPLLLDNTISWLKHLESWNSNNRPICVHAESRTLAAILHIARLCDRKLHVCHVARKEEIELIKYSKQMGMDITCEVSPHHLFYTEQDVAEDLRAVKPPLVKKEDQQALWDNLDIIDCFATDHAPHTKQDKLNKNCPGFPGLETALPLLLTAVNEGRLTLDDIIKRYHINPIKIFNLKEQPNTYIEIDIDRKWTIPDKMTFSKCGWTPFSDKQVIGMVKRVVLRSKVVYVDGEILNKPGYGIDLRDNDQQIIIPKSPKLKHVTHITKELISLDLKNILSVNQFNRDMLKYIFDVTDEMKELVEKHGTCNILQDKVLGLIFYEPSTRTKCSFSAAMKRLGGQVVEILADDSSHKKGESLSDFVKCISCYTDAIVIRNSRQGSLNSLTKAIKLPILNAGDGIGEHPTQALLDVYTIRKELGTVNGLTVALVGDLKHSRTVHSLAKLLSLYNVRLRYISPPQLKMPNDIIDYTDKRGIEQIEQINITDELDKIDVLYMTRIQRERFESKKDYDKYKGVYILTPQMLTNAKDRLAILHPLPRVDEISVDLDNDPRAAYFRQMKNGMYVRMALLKIIFNR